jgi:LPXTG-site transpeptidase (sortase) family protein
MPEFKFSSDNKRTKKIPVQAEKEPAVSFELGVSKPHFGGEVLKNEKTPVKFQTAPQQQFLNEKLFTKSQKTPARKRTIIPVKIWNLLEWLTTSMAIFLVLFMIINFNSYSELFVSKVDQLKGNLEANPYIAQQLEKVKLAAPDAQKPLPIVQNQVEEKKQIPDLNLEITPPDDRIIIPRINKNVPIVRVSTEKLIQKDWNGLEAQIQDALKYGVVHFPGTALPGYKGNVVITGHSSYFPWDAGRFKDVFALLHQVSVGDEIIVYYNQGKFRYIVYDKQVVQPSQIEVLTQKGENRLTLITCTPVGTNLRRLVVLAKPIDEQ